MEGDYRRSTIGQLFRLWKLYGTMDLMFMTRDLKLVLTYYISDVISNTASVSATLLLAERFDGIGGWTKFQIVFMLGYATAVSGIMWTFFNYNALHISRRLGRGQLDHTLIQPQPIWMALLTEGFTPFSSSAILVPGFVLIIWATAKLSLTVTPAWLAMAALNLVASSAVVLALARRRVLSGTEVAINAAYVRERVGTLARNADLSRFIL